MARGVHGSRRRAIDDLRRRNVRVSPVCPTLALAAILPLAACAESSAPATLPPAPTLAVVTATPGPPPVPTPSERQRYIVREGDTLSGIAAQFGVSEDAILEANPLSDRDRLLVGQELVIPAAAP